MPSEPFIDVPPRRVTATVKLQLLARAEAIRAALGSFVSDESSTAQETGNSQGIKKETPPSGLKILYDGSESAVDIVFVHGLGGHREHTWRLGTDANEQASWPQDLLSADVPNSRIMTFGYDTDSTSSMGSLQDCAYALTTSLRAVTPTNEVESRRIIFVCHSIGGLIVKRALLLAETTASAYANKSPSLLDQTAAVLFLGTPHLGLDHSLYARTFISRLDGDPTVYGLPGDWKLRSADLSRMNQDFLETLQRQNPPKTEVICFFEARATPAYSGLVVNQKSAVLDGCTAVALDSCHKDLTKVAGRDDPQYRILLEHILRGIAEAHMAYVEGHSSGANLEVSQLQGAERQALTDIDENNKVTSSHSFDGALSHRDTEDAVPTGDSKATRSSASNLTSAMIPYPRNPGFVGQEEVLDAIGTIHANVPLSNLKEEQPLGLYRGHRAVLTGPPGTGKTQVAVEYAHRSMAANPELRVFWVRGESKERFTESYGEIAQSYAIGQVGRDTGMRYNIRAVRRWLENAEFRWLMIVDDASLAKGYFEMDFGIPHSPKGLVLFTTWHAINLGNDPTSSFELFKAGSKVKGALELEKWTQDKGTWIEVLKLYERIEAVSPVVGTAAAPADPSHSETASEIASIFSTSESITSSRTSEASQGLQRTSVEEIADILLSREDLRDLYIIGVRLVESKKCRAHFKGFLKEFATALKLEVSDHLELYAATFIDSAAGRVADEIRQSVFTPPESTAARTIAQSRLDEWLARIKGRGNGSPQDALSSDSTAEPAVLGQAGMQNEADEDDRSEPGIQAEAFGNVAHVRDFILDAKATEALIENMKAWLRIGEVDQVDNEESPGPTDHQIDLATEPDVEPEIKKEARGSESDDADPTMRTIGSDDYTRMRHESPRSSARRLVRTLRNSCAHIYHHFSPGPSSGYHRLRWTCSCGHVLWGDFAVTEQHALCKLIGDLQRISDTVDVQRPAEMGQKACKMSYSKASASPANPGCETCANPLASSSNMNPRQDGATSTPVSDAQPSAVQTVLPDSKRAAPRTPSSAPATLSMPIVVPNAPNPRFFEVCVNTGNHAIRLDEIDLAQVRTDRELFALVWNAYRQKRGWGRLLLKPRDVHFVMFSVARATGDLAGIHKKPEEYPPQQEIDEKRYTYACPKIIMPANIFLHFLHLARLESWNPHARSDDTWLQRVPIKLHTAILARLRQAANPVAIANPDAGWGASPSGEVQYGWGVHILEGPNHLILSAIFGFGVLLALAVSCMIIGIAKTQEQGFGIGQFLLAAVVCAIGVLYSALTDY